MDGAGSGRVRVLAGHLAPAGADVTLPLTAAPATASGAAPPEGLRDGYTVVLPESLQPHDAPWLVRRCAPRLVPPPPPPRRPGPQLTAPRTTRAQLRALPRSPRRDLLRARRPRPHALRQLRERGRQVPGRARAAFLFCCFDLRTRRRLLTFFTHYIPPSTILSGPLPRPPRGRRARRAWPLRLDVVPRGGRGAHRDRLGPRAPRPAAGRDGRRLLGQLRRWVSGLLGRCLRKHWPVVLSSAAQILLCPLSLCFQTHHPPTNNHAQSGCSSTRRYTRTG